MELPLSKGYVALIDDEDCPLVADRRWYAQEQRRNGRIVGVYAVAHGLRRRGEPPGMIVLHRLIMQAPPGVHVDHVNRNTLDCRKQNLRCATPSQNGANSIAKSESVPFKGVFRKRHRFGAKIEVARKPIWLGVYETAEQAAIAYDNAAREYFGDFARLNFPDRREPPPERYKPLRANGRWSALHDACISCGTTESRHTGRGLCRRCHPRKRNTNR